MWLRKGRKRKFTVKAESERKLVKSYYGFASGIAIAVLMHICFAIGIRFVYLSHIGSNITDVNEKKFMLIIGLNPDLYTQNGTFIFYTAITFYLLGCLTYMYVPLRAMVQPTFLAGNPDESVRNQTAKAHLFIHFLSFRKFWLFLLHSY